MVTLRRQSSWSREDLVVDHDMSVNSRVVIVDLGQRIQKPSEQLRALAAEVKNGLLDIVAATVG
jgi:hypothetical protein